VSHVFLMTTVLLNDLNISLLFYFNEN